MAGGFGSHRDSKEIGARASREQLGASIGWRFSVAVRLTFV